MYSDRRVEINVDSHWSTNTFYLSIRSLSFKLLTERKIQRTNLIGLYWTNESLHLFQRVYPRGRLPLYMLYIYSFIGINHTIWQKGINFFLSVLRPLWELQRRARAASPPFEHRASPSDAFRYPSDRTVVDDPDSTNQLLYHRRRAKH